MKLYIRAEAHDEEGNPLTYTDPFENEDGYDQADIDGVRIVSAYLTGTGADTLRDMVDKVRDKAPNAVTVLIGSDGNKTMMAVGVSKNAMARGLKAGALVKKIAAIAGGNGGGKPDFAMAGIRDTSKIDDALNAVPEIVKAEMNQ